MFACMYVSMYVCAYMYESMPYIYFIYHLHFITIHVLPLCDVPVCTIPCLSGYGRCLRLSHPLWTRDSGRGRGGRRCRPRVYCGSLLYSGHFGNASGGQKWSSHPTHSQPHDRGINQLSSSTHPLMPHSLSTHPSYKTLSYIISTNTLPQPPLTV